MISVSRMALPGALFLLTLLTGVWVTSTGRPLNTVVFTIHKLIALAAVVLTVLALYPAVRAGDARALLTGILVLSGLLILALFASGALLSQATPAPLAVLRVHQIAPLLALAGLAAAVALLVGSSS